MRWEKLGCIFTPRGSHPLLATHAANPVPVLLHGDHYRIYYSGRDAKNRSSIGYVDMDIKARRILGESGVPVFRFGPKDSFYSHGVSLGGGYVAPNGTRYLGFMGWHIPPGAHWHGEIGRLRIEADGSLTLDPRTPWLGIDAACDPISLSYPFVLRMHDGTYRLWYGSTLSWDAGNGDMLHILHHAHSHDGEHWQRLGPATPYAIGAAQAFSHPCVIADAQGYHLWFSYRRGTGDMYRIGYASSDDAQHWTLRLNEVGIETSSTGWDSEMLCYPYVWDHDGTRYMLYNGNGHGRSGFGLAVWRE